MMLIDAQGLLAGSEYVPSPNCDDRPETAVELLVIHNISLPPGEFGSDDVQEFFTNTLNEKAHPYYRHIAGVRVSAHFYLRRNGKIIQFVPISKRAWHAGKSCWQGRSNCNDFSLGIELEGSDTVAYTDEQYDALHDLTIALRAAHPLRGIAGHSDIAPQRKTDPGASFDWLRYLTGLSV